MNTHKALCQLLPDYKYIKTQLNERITIKGVHARTVYEYEATITLSIIAAQQQNKRNFFLIL